MLCLGDLHESDKRHQNNTLRTFLVAHFLLQPSKTRRSVSNRVGARVREPMPVTCVLSVLLFAGFWVLVQIWNGLGSVVFDPSEGKK